MTHPIDPLTQLPHPFLARLPGCASLRKCGTCRFFTPPKDARAELEAVSPAFREVMRVLSPAEINLTATPEGAQFPSELQPKVEGGEEFKPVAARKVPNPAWNDWGAFGICRHPDHSQGRWFGDHCDDWDATKPINRAVYASYFGVAITVAGGLVWWLGLVHGQ